VEGKIVNKFDMRPHNQNLELYGKLCRERTKKYTVKNRQIRVFFSYEFHSHHNILSNTTNLPMNSPELYFPGY
jgi:hypothetical protein